MNLVCTQNQAEMSRVGRLMIAPRYRDARKTRFQPCPLRLWSDGTFTRVPFGSFSQRTVKCCGSAGHDQAASLGWLSLE